MWVLKLVFFLVLLFLLVAFFVANGDQTVDITLLGRDFLDLNIFWVVVASFGLGVLASLGLLVIREWQHHREHTRLRRDNAAKSKELADLRTLPLRDLPTTKSQREDA